MNRKALLLVFALLTPAWAYYDNLSEDFGPYRDDETVPKVALKELQVLESRVEMDKTEVGLLGDKGDLAGPQWTLRTLGAESTTQRSELELRVPGRKKPFRLTREGWRIVAIRTADLNGDGKPDYLLDAIRPAKEEQNEEAAYLPTQNGAFAVVLSDRKGYQAFWVEKGAAPSWGVLRIRPDQGTEILVDTDYMKHKEKMEEGARVIFHIYQLLTVRGAVLKLDNSPDQRFPKIVAQDLAATHKNHKETKLLTDEEKKGILLQDGPQLEAWPFQK